jgi:hypothetical protein
MYQIVNTQDQLESAGGSILGPQTKQLLTLGEENHWPTQILGRAPMLEEPIRVREWVLMPSTMDSTQLPGHAVERIYDIYVAGIRPQGFVIAHEAPLEIEAPLPEVKRKDNSDLLKKIGGAALGVGVLSGSIVALAGIAILGGILLAPIGILGAAVVLDPTLVVVTTDNYWIEIDRWDVA